MIAVAPVPAVMVVPPVPSVMMAAIPAVVPVVTMVPAVVPMMIAVVVAMSPVHCRDVRVALGERRHGRGALRYGRGAGRAQGQQPECGGCQEGANAHSLLHFQAPWDSTP